MAAIKSINQLESEGFRMVADSETGWAVFVAEPNEAGWAKVNVRHVDGVKRGKQGLRSHHLNWNGERFARTSQLAAAPHGLVVWAETVLKEQAA